MRRFQLKHTSTGDAVADGVCFDDGVCTVQWFTHPRRVQRFATVDDLLVEQGSLTMLSWIDAPTMLTVEADCGCDFVQTLGHGPDGLVEVHHQFPDDGAPHVESLECGCRPSITVQLPNLISVDHADQDYEPLQPALPIPAQSG